LAEPMRTMTRESFGMVTPAMVSSAVVCLHRFLAAPYIFQTVEMARTWPSPTISP
jgi:hypothetical protein